MIPLFASKFGGFGLPELLVVAAILSALLVVFAIPATVLAYVVLNRIPRQFRKQEPSMAFLLLIPLFSLVWNFFVHPKVAESLKAYFDAQGPHSNGDCGGALALWMCVCGACTFVPTIGIPAAVAGLVLMVVFYVRAIDLSARIPKKA